MGGGVVLADFFSGCGGVSLGFGQAGIRPVFATDWDDDSVDTYRSNFPDVAIHHGDIRDLNPLVVAEQLPPADADTTVVFAGCPPCQPFANHQKHSRAGDSRRFLLLEFLRFIDALRPDVIFVENVAGIQRIDGRGSPLASFVAEISKTYAITHKTVTSADYGVPQMRRRLVLLASKIGPISIPPPTHGSASGVPYSTPRDWMHGLPRVEAGGTDRGDPSHTAYRLSEKNYRRIRATPEGGDRRDWPAELWPDCHKGSFNGHLDVYGRLAWDKPTSALTTRCVSYSNGRYGHPDQDRALTAREAGLLQTFPGSYRFSGPLTSQARQIGNAVPVLLAQRVAEHLLEHIEAGGSQNAQATLW